MFKRIWLFLLSNIAILLVISIIIMIAENIFGINISWYGQDYTSIFIYALIVWFTWSFLSLFISKWMAKRAYDIQLIDIKDVSSLDEKSKLVWQVVVDLAERNRIKMPEVGIYESTDPNAFATWATKNSSLVAVSTGLLDAMNKDAIEWVIAHEMTHILNGDMVTMTLLQWLINTFVIFFAKIIANIASSFVDEEKASLVRIVADIFFQLILWIFASLIVMRFSRYREFKADEGSARFVWKQKMIAWLKALQNMQNLAMWDDEKMATMKISTKSKSGIMALFSSHPDLEDRIQALENLNI